jgi:hypothetical protein
MIVSHWPTKMIGPGGESYIVSHLTQSIFSGWGLGGGEMKQCTLDVVKTDRGLMQLGNALTSMISPPLNYAYLLLLLLLQFMFCQMLILPKALGLGGWERGTERL